MERTISVMVGKGSVNHNSRVFHAKNTDPERSDQNICYVNESIKNVYHELFDEALERYNAKQTRADRCISDYYEKICSGKQEKPFHEVILQIGNRDDTNAQSAEGQLAVKILDEYMQGFQDRNPYLWVFSAHLHMDEATPHLHIDFVPFITGSKRGLDTRVSLKQALAAQGFSGGTRQDTEWNQWVQSEKAELAIVMDRYGVQWERKGTHEKHLSVLDYEKKMRAQEVAELEADFQSLKKRVAVYENVEAEMVKTEQELETSPDYQLTEPSGMMSARAYMKKVAEPLVRKLKDLVKNILVRLGRVLDDYNKMSRHNNRLYNEAQRLRDDNRWLNSKCERLSKENNKLRREAKDFGAIKKVLGPEQVEKLLDSGKRQMRRNRDVR